MLLIIFLKAILGSFYIRFLGLIMNLELFKKCLIIMIFITLKNKKFTLHIVPLEQQAKYSLSPFVSESALIDEVPHSNFMLLELFFVVDVSIVLISLMF